MTDGVANLPQSGIAGAGGQSRLSIGEAVAQMSANRQAAAQASPVSEAARTLAARAAEARAQRAQAQAAPSQDADDGTPADADPIETVEPSGADNLSEPDAVAPDATVEDNAATETESEPAQEPTIEVEGIGKLTASEVKNGYMRQADATRKWQEAASIRQQAQSALEQRLPELDKLIAALKPEVASEPDWLALAQNDPLGWPAKRAEWDKKQAVLKQAEAARQREQEISLAQAQQAMWGKLTAGEYAKDGLDPTKLNEIVPKIGAYARSFGYDPQEVASISDVRELVLLDKARRWDALQAEKAKVQPRVANKPPAQKPGARPTGTTTQQSQVQRERQAMLSKNSMTLQEAQAHMKRLRQLTGGRAA